MSASLVGSEMCIRDRSGTGRQTPRGHLSERVRVRKAPNGARKGPLLTACLLYTSDAADDM
eukprot:11891507-Alexandrium_andersonii.AAC.1